MPQQVFTQSANLPRGNTLTTHDTLPSDSSKAIVNPGYGQHLYFYPMAAVVNAAQEERY